MTITLDPINLIVIIPQSERAAAWKGRKLTKQGSRFKAAPTRTEEAATRALRREIEKQDAEKRAARFAALKERFKR